jgi:5-methyltetrahydropteroyltriglutamate--homocysteine methyltransferase
VLPTISVGAPHVRRAAAEENQIVQASPSAGIRPPFRADHVGSFLRPKTLLDARTARQEGRIDAAALRAAEDTAIRDVVRFQEELGLHGITDGEFRRTFFHTDFLLQLDGI